MDQMLRFVTKAALDGPVRRDRSSGLTLLCLDQNEAQGVVGAFCYVRGGGPRVNEAEALRPIRFGHRDARRNKCREPAFVIV